MNSGDNTMLSSGRFIIFLAFFVLATACVASTVTAIPKCAAPEQIANGKVATPSGLKVYAKAFYKCHMGFYISSGNAQRVCGKNLLWSGTQPDCTVGCPQPHTPENGEKIFGRTGYPVGSKIQLRCAAGYETNNIAITECLDDLTWSNVTLSCNKISCGTPATIENGELHSDSLLYKGITKYHCNEGYKLTGISKRYCQSSAVWSGESPRCKSISCKRPAIVENVMDQTLKLTYGFGDTITYECKKGFNMIGNPLIKCTTSSKWTENPKCQKVACDNFPNVVNGHVESSKLKHFVGDKVNINCYRGFELIGPSVISCTATGAWQALPMCRELHTCIKEVSNAIYSASSTWKFWFTHFTADQGRLNGIGWMADSYSATEYLEIAFSTPQSIAKIRTKGGKYRGYSVYLKKIKIQYKSSKNDHFRTYHENGQDKIFNANSDSHTEVDQTFEYGDLTAIAIRIFPVGKEFNHYLYLRAGVFVYC